MGVKGMNGFAKFVFIAIVGFLAGAVSLVGQASGQEPLGEYQQTEVPPEFARRIEGLVAVLGRAAPSEYDRSFADNRSARELIEIGGPAIPFLMSVMRGERSAQGGCPLMAMRVLGEMGVAKKADVVSHLCEFLESSVSDISYHTGGAPGKIRLAEAQQAYGIAIGEGAADLLAEIGDKRALASLVSVVEATQEKADLEYADEKRPAAQRLDDLYTTGHAAGVLEAAVRAIGKLSDEESQRALEELAQGTSPSVRVAARCAVAKSMKDKGAATDYLRKCIETEEHPEAKEQYEWYLDEVISRRKDGAAEAVEK